MAEVTPELVRQLLDGASLDASGGVLRDLALDIAAAYLQVCEERDQLAAKIERIEKLAAYALAQLKSEIMPVRGLAALIDLALRGSDA